MKNIYFEGKKLYGDDFTPQEIEEWVNDESHGFDEIPHELKKKSEEYEFHNLNRLHGFSKLPKNKKFEKVLGVGSAWGYEFEPYIERIGEITIIEPSDKLTKNHIGSLTPKYIKPNVSGKMNFEDNYFDLITFFGTLHHIPNVSFVISEALRVLKPGGYMLIREPINSMGDWTTNRKHLTKHERGIPTSVFENAFKNNNGIVISKTYIFTATFALQRLVDKFSKLILIKNNCYLRFDKIISKLMSWSKVYHATHIWQRFGPQNVFYVISKK